MTRQPPREQITSKYIYMSKAKETMRERSLRLLKTLTETDGAPGHEREVKAVIRKELAGIAALSEDSMGSLIAEARGNKEGPAVLFSAHMDEVGFVVKEITPDGFIRFAALGDWWSQVLLGQRVVIKTRNGDVTGVIGATAPICFLLNNESFWFL